MTGLIFAACVVAFLLLIMGRVAAMRVVVPTNDIHIVQSAKRTISYGKDQPAGNVYYKWPAKLPRFGLSVSVLPVSVFSQTLTDYNAYDKGRVPFMIDVIGFFRIKDSNIAAQRIVDLRALKEQLDYILKGSIRSILATNEIEQILEGRSEFGRQFTEAVDGQLAEWGMMTVKALELMDIRDVAGGHVIENIMNKQKSRIEMESRQTVAGNMKTAKQAEIEAQREVAISEQQAQETVGLRQAEREQLVGIREQQAQQAIQEQAKETKTKEMAVLEVETVRRAEIAKASQIVAAEQQKQVMVTQAEGSKQQQILSAEAALEVATHTAQGIMAKGEAEGSAEQAKLLAPVNAQITLAKEIGANAEYQKYLISLRQLEAAQSVGMEQARALEKANVKIITNAGAPVEGLNSVMDLFTPRGGLQIGAALEALAETDAGQAVLSRVVGVKPNGKGDTAGQH